VTPAAPPDRVAAALRRPIAGNPFLSFAEADSAGGRPASEFGAAVPALLSAVAHATGASEPRVAASLVVLGYSARLLGPSVAVLLRDGVLLDVAPARVRFAYAAGTGFRLALPVAAGFCGPGLAARWREVVIDDHLAMVVAAVRAEVRVAAGLLWGNIASGLVGTLAALVRADVAPVDACAAFATGALAGGPLSGSGSLDDSLRFRRRSCCLYYRIPGGGYCGDCSFTAGWKTGRRERFR
jgi:ferric iron reductase protein FhuF